MIDREIKIKLLNIDQMPTLPEVMVRILEAVDNDETSAHELSEILEQDHTLTSRLLRLANSAFYGFPSQIDTVRRAIVVIGLNELRMLALATSVFDTFYQLKQFALDPYDFWMHSLGTAKAASLIASEIQDDCNVSICFTAGILHDIGKYALATTLQKTYKNIINEAKTCNTFVKDAELKTLNTTHAEVGAWLAQHWNFPPSLHHPIANLYQCLKSKTNYIETSIVALGDYLSRLAGFGNAGDPQNICPPDTLLENLRINNTGVEKILNDLKEHFQSAELFLDILSGE